MAIKLIVGLRNPGATYAHTRHNAGAWFVEQLAHHYNVTFKSEKKLQGELANVETDGVVCRLLLPFTFMNHSGLSTRAVSQYYSIKPHEILVVHDELDLPVGKLRLKMSGGHGGHNGLRDIINQLGTADFLRLRIGIGHPGHKHLVTNFVLSKPTQHERQQITEAIERAILAIPNVLSDNLAAAMNAING